MCLGDHLWVHRGGYEHHGIDDGEGCVVHYAGGKGHEGTSNSSAVQRCKMQQFSDGAVVNIRTYQSAEKQRVFPPEVVVQRAYSRVGENKYHLVFNNCEHFATWCKCNKHRSAQASSRRVSTPH